MNKVLLLGRVAKEPELKYTLENNKPYLKFILAVDREYTSKNGEKGADFIQIALWGRKSESLVQYLKKGRLINVIGKLKTGNYETEDKRKVYVTEIEAEQINFLDGKLDKKQEETMG